MATTLDEFGRETRSEAAGLGSQTADSVREAYTSTVDDVKAATDVRALKEDAYATGVATANLGDSSTALVSSVGSSGDAYAELGETAGLVAQEVLVRKLEQLRSQLFEMRSIKLKSLLNSTGAFITTATTPGEFVASISSNTSKMVGRLPATLKKAATEMAVEVGSDPRVLESLASLKEVQALAKTLDSIYNMYAAVRKIADKFEFAFPIIEITVSAAMIWCTGGGAAAKMSSESAQLAMQELKKIIPLVAKPTKDYIYNKEIRVPAMLIGMLDTLSTQEASDRFAALKQEAEEYLLADDARYTEINNSLKFPGVYNRLTSTVITKSSLAQAFVEKYLGGSPLASTLMRTIMAADGWAERRDRLEVYGGYVSRHALASCIQDFELRDKDIRRISRLIVDNKDTSASFYTDRQMHKLVVAHLASDGCVIDTDREAYDELATATLPEGDRLAFKIINDRIIALHGLLSVLTGEQRANIRETIPVIDFYKRTFTGLSNCYTDDVEFDTITPVINYRRDDPKIPPSWQLLKSDHPSTINMALDGYPMAEYFYNTRARVSDESNLIVEYTTNTNPEAPGLLNGLFSEKVAAEEATASDFPYGGYIKFNEVVRQLNSVSNNSKPKRWRWFNPVDPAERRTANLPLGTMYNPTHLMNKGTIVARPLETTRAGYPGLATAIYASVQAFVDGMRTRYTIPTEEWASYGCMLDSVVTPDLLGDYNHRQVGRIINSREAKYWWETADPDAHKYALAKESLVRYTSKVKALTLMRRDSWSLGPGRALDGTYWTNLNQVIADPDTGVEKRWLVIDADDTSKVIFQATYSGNNYSEPTVTDYNGSLIDRPVAVYGPTTTGHHETPPAEPELADALAADPVRHIAVALGWDGTSVGFARGYPRNIRIITPIALLGRTDADREDTILFSTESAAGDSYRGVPDAMWLVSRKNLGFDITANRVFASFTRDNRSVALRVTEVHHIDPETDRIKIRYRGTWYTYDPDDDSNSSHLPRVEIVGGSCYLYKLETIQPRDVVIDGDGLNHLAMGAGGYWNPLRSDQDILNGEWEMVDGNPFLRRSTVRNKASVHVLKNSMIAVNLPTLTAEAPTYAYFNKQGVNYKPFDRMLMVQAITAYVSAFLANITIIAVADYEFQTRVELRHMHTLLAPWTDASAKNALMGYAKDGSVTGLDNIHKMVARFEKLSKLSWALEHGTLTPALCAEADALLGNAAEPWITIDDGPDADVSYDTLSALVQRIKKDLLGSETQGLYPVRFIEGDDRATGRVDSLYYQRYMLLNARMHRTEGSLAKAAFLLYNWQIVKDARKFQDAQTENYTDFLDAIAIPQMDELMYVPPKTEAEDGRFYVRALLDDIRQQISDKCMLVCAPCPVKDSCPFYDESTILYMYVPPASTLDIYVKDNELDLLVYEQDEFGRDYLDIKGDNGKRLDAAEMKNRHRAYTEIMHNEAEELNLDVVRETIANKVNGFRIQGQENMYVDGLDWLHGGRYGSLVKATEYGRVVANPVKHKYLYDALFIRDQESNVLYGETSAAYPVAFDSKEATDDIVHYTGNVRLKKPIDIVLSRDADNRPIPLSQVSDTSELWLVSDDELDSEGNAMVPLIFLNEVRNLHYDFEFIESGEPIESDTDPRYPGAADVAQWVVNTYKWMDPTEDKYWMPSITKVVRSSKKGETAVIELPGRPRVSDVVDPLITKAPPVEDILKGKPYVRNYINFVRKVRFQLSDIRWTKSDNRVDIELKKKQLASMKTNLRLVLVKK